MIGPVQDFLDRFHGFWDFLFREWNGYAVWAWLLVVTWVGLMVVGAVGVVFWGWDLGHRCNSNGDCQYEW